jgi:hypothetical protein
MAAQGIRTKSARQFGSRNRQRLKLRKRSNSRSTLQRRISELKLMLLWSDLPVKADPLVSKRMRIAGNTDTNN